MGEPIRAPEEVGSWSWTLPTKGWPGASELIEHLALVVPPLAHSELLHVTAVEVLWREQGGKEESKKILTVESGIIEKNLWKRFATAFLKDFRIPK